MTGSIRMVKKISEGLDKSAYRIENGAHRRWIRKSCGSIGVNGDMNPAIGWNSAKDVITLRP